jgi:hypothetical protein
MMRQIRRPPSVPALTASCCLLLVQSLISLTCGGTLKRIQARAPSLSLRCLKSPGLWEPIDSAFDAMGGWVDGWVGATGWCCGTRSHAAVRTYEMTPVCCSPYCEHRGPNVRPDLDVTLSRTMQDKDVYCGGLRGGNQRDSSGMLDRSPPKSCTVLHHLYAWHAHAQCSTRA